MNYGRTILPTFVLIGAFAAVLALMPHSARAQSPHPSISASPAVVSSANQSISFSWGPGTVSNARYYYYQTAYVDYAQSRWVYSPWVYLGTSSGSATKTLMDFGFSRPGMYYFSLAVIDNLGSTYYSETKQVAFPKTTVTEQNPNGQPCGFTPSGITSLALSQTSTKSVYFFTDTSGNLTVWPHTLRYAVYTPSGGLSWDSGGWSLNDYCWFQYPFSFPPQTAPGTWRVDTYFDGQVVQSNPLTIISSVPAPSSVSLSISPSTITLGQSSTFSWSATNANEYWLWSQTAQAWEQLGSSAGSFSRSSAGSPTGTHWFYAGAYNRPNPTFIYSSWQSLTINQPVPTVPANFSFSPSSGIQGYITTASWSASSYTERYEYYAPALGISAWTSIGNVTSIPLNTSSFSPNIYTVSLRACNSSGCSGGVNSSFTVQQATPSAPSVSVSPATITTLQSATFSWGSASNASTCTVFINGADSGAVSCGGGSQTFLGSNLGVGTHTGYIRACNTTGCVNSNTVQLRVLARLPPFLRF